MRVHAGLAHSPLFVPAVGNYYQGKLVQAPLQLWALPATPKPGDLRDALADHYAGQDFVSVATAEESKGLEGLDPEGLNGTNDLSLYVFGNAADDQAMLAAVLDNLGKGASGAAVQNMNLMLGLDPKAASATRSPACAHRTGRPPAGPPAPIAHTVSRLLLQKKITPTPQPADLHRLTTIQTNI